MNIEEMSPETQRTLGEWRNSYETTWLMSERAQHLCEWLEASPACEQQTKCSLLAAQLRKELEIYEQTRPMTAEETASIQAAWKSFSASSPNDPSSATPPGKL